MIQFIDFLKERGRGVRYILYGTMAAIVIWSMTVDTSHAHTWVEKHIPGFWSIFGLVSCTVLIFFARWLASAGIEREEDYYDD
jgi:hypothetical protein